MSIGVLALQGDFDLHRKALDRLGIESVEVRLPRQLDQIGGLIMPGGESTTLLKLLDEWEFLPARDVESPKQPSLGFIDITAVRNAYGRQKESFETEGEADLGEGPRSIKMVFIRAPRISRVGSAVTPLVRHKGETVMARHGSVLVAAFHPELTEDPTVHRYFATMVRQVAG